MKNKILPLMSICAMASPLLASSPEEAIVSPARDISFTSPGLELTKNSPLENWQRYVSINVSGLVARNGIFGIGLRKLNSTHGGDIGLNPGMGTNFSQFLGHGSYLYKLTSWEKGSYYVGIGAQAGWIWLDTVSQSLKYAFGTFPRYTLGYSYEGLFGQTQFIEINTTWPRGYFMNFKGNNRYYYLDTRNYVIEIFYGTSF